MTDHEELQSSFDDRLLEHLQRLIPLPDARPSTAPARRRLPVRRWPMALAGIPVLAGFATVAAVLLASNGTPAAFAIGVSKGTVTATISSFQDQKGLEQALSNAGVRAMVQVLPVGQDCRQQPTITPLPSSALPSFNPATTPNGSVPIEIGGGGGQPLSLVLNPVPAGATLVIESSPSATAARPSPAVMNEATVVDVGSRPVYVLWAQGTVTPCDVVASPGA
jgi:hypothetical protein